MKNNLLIFLNLFFLIILSSLNAQELEINSSEVKYNDVDKIIVFEGAVNSVDNKGNKLFSEYVKYNKIEEILETKGDTKIITSADYEIIGTNIILDNKKKIIFSSNKANIIDKEGNNIIVEMFNYSILNNIFFSKGNIKIKDMNNNEYNLSEIYIDEKEKKIVGSDIKAFLNQPEISPNPLNDPRFFANTFFFSKNTSVFEKGIFTYCQNKENETCPWTLQSKKIKHDLAKKTIYYDNVILKIYDFPIFFSPKFSHPDPTVKRASGFLTPLLSNSTNLGSGFVVPYFFNIAGDKDFTLTPKLYFNENPLFLGEYRQDFSNSFFIADAGFGEGYKKKKSGGNIGHFFTNFNLNLINEEEKKSSFEIKTEKVSNDTYFKIFDFKSSLANANKSVLENKIDYFYQNKDFYFAVNPSFYEDTNKLGNKRYEYLLPLNLEKNLLTYEKYGLLNLGSNIHLRNYETDKQTDFLVNNFNWKSNTWLNSFGIKNYFEGVVKNVNYKSQNTKEHKNNKDNFEIHPAIGYFSEFPLYNENSLNKTFETLSPKFLLRYAPGQMRNVDGGKLNYGNLFNLNKVEKIDVLEKGLSASIGFEYKKNKLDETNIIGEEQLSLSIGQVINAKENIDIPASTSLDQHFSDIVGESKYNINNNISLNYNFALDQGYKTLNYNELNAEFAFEKAKFNLGFLEEKNHIGKKEYIQSGVEFKINDSSGLDFNFKRNLLTNSSDFYNLNYSYFNDCLKAAITYRREFYTDRDLKANNSLMFTISIIPFAEINAPAYRN